MYMYVYISCFKCVYIKSFASIKQIKQKTMAKTIHTHVNTNLSRITFIPHTHTCTHNFPVPILAARLQIKGILYRRLQFPDQIAPFPILYSS